MQLSKVKPGQKFKRGNGLYQKIEENEGLIHILDSAGNRRKFTYFSLDTYTVAASDQDYNVQLVDDSGNIIPEPKVYKLRWQYIDDSDLGHDIWVNAEFSSYEEAFQFIKKLVAKQSKSMIRWEWDKV